MRRIFIIIIIAAVLLTLLAMGLIWWSGRTPSASNTNQTDENTNVPLDSNTNTVDIGVTDATARTEATSAARAFSERFGSWTKVNAEATLLELRGQMTATFAASNQTTHESTSAPDSLQSIVSEVLSSEMKEWVKDDSRATVELILRRVESRTGEAKVEYYETLTLTLLRDNNQWFVDSAAWSPSRVQPSSNGG
jgi:hypothetical protein